MSGLKQLKKQRQRRLMRVREHIKSTATRPRLSVFRSGKNFYCQIIDDMAGRTLCAMSTQQKDVRGQVPKGGTIQAAAVVGQKLAELAKSKGIDKVVLDRGQYNYHGRVKAFAEAARKAGLQF